MSQHSKGARRPAKGTRMWTHVRAQAALPYVTNVLHSLREHWIEMRIHRARAKKLGEKPGRLDRAAMIAVQDAHQEAHKAAMAYHDAQKELQALGITCLDPARGEALFPIQHKRKLAWLLCDLFDSQPLRFWRFQDDPADVRRPVGSSEDAPAV